MESSKTTTMKIFTIASFVCSLSCLVILSSNHGNMLPEKCMEQKEVDEILYQDTLSIDLVREFLYSKRIEHPDIVLAQIKLESGNLTSELFIENNNFLGMKYAVQRPTGALGKKNGYANYDSWEDCVYDYMVWQSRYAKKLSKEEYFDYLGENYAQDKSYISKLKQLIDAEE